MNDKEETDKMIQSLPDDLRKQVEQIRDDFLESIKVVDCKITDISRNFKKDGLIETEIKFVPVYKIDYNKIKNILVNAS